jgi:hypothetical protein
MSGDFTLGVTLDFKFTSRAFTTGAPFTLAGSPVVSAYPDNSTTEITAGITLTVDFDGVTGLNNIRVVATSGNGYADGTSYALVITTGTVNGVSVVGEVVGEFTLGRASTANLTQIGGVAQSATDLKDFADDGYDPATNKVQGVVLADTLTTYTANTPQTGDGFARLGTPAGASVSADILVVKNFIDTEIAAIQADTDDIQTRLPAVLVSGKMDSNVALWSGGTVVAPAVTGIPKVDVTHFGGVGATTSGGIPSVDAAKISGSTTAADKLELGALSIETGAAIAGTLSTTEMTTDLTEATNSHYNGRTIIWTSGVLLRQASAITAYDGSTKKLTYTAVTEAPSAADTFILV